MKKHKPGGGGKPQPYIPAGNGEKSGQYAKKDEIGKTFDCYIKNSKFKCNFKKSSLVKQTTHFSVADERAKIPTNFVPNSVIKRIINGYVVTERYYNENGEVYLDIDYTCHGNPKTHPHVPHIHRWEKDERGKLHRLEGEQFK